MLIQSLYRFVALPAMAFCTVLLPAVHGAEPPLHGQPISVDLRGVHFVPNHGQWEDDEIVYGFKSRGLDVAFRESSLTMHLRRETKPSPDREGAVLDSRAASPLLLREGGPNRNSDDSSALNEYLTLEVTFPGSNAVIPRAVNEHPARFNYFIGDDKNRWASDVPSYGMIVYEGIYDGIDLHVLGSDGGVLKYEFHCQPGADHTQVRIRYDGIDALCIDDRSGDLLIETSFGTLRDKAPIVWQTDPSRTLRARFKMLDRHTYTITLDAAADPSLPLVIDPEVDWMYYLGGSSSDRGNGLALDSSGNTFVTGSTRSTDFTQRNNFYYGFTDAYALKVSPSGDLQWMTYLGGSGIVGDYGHGIAVDSAGDALVTGQTDSNDFAGSNNSRNGRTDSFALKISASGQLQWMTYLGGSQHDYGHGIAVDNLGNALLTGYTESADFAGRINSYFGGTSDAFALKVSRSGELQWMNYAGGSSGDLGFSIAADSASNVLVGGYTRSTDFAERNNSHYGDEDAVALKFSPSGQLQWMTYLGGRDYDFGFGIAVDSVGNALVAGYTNSIDFAGRNNSCYGDEDAFAVKVSPSGQVQWMTYLGGSYGDSASGIVVDSTGNALVTGRTQSTDFAGRNNSYYGDADAFALKVSPSGVLEWMTYLGGIDSDSGKGIAAESASNVLVAGYTTSTDFAGRNNSHYGGTWDAFIVKLRLADGPQLTVDATCPDGGPINISWNGATPGGQVAVIFARNTGSFTIPPQYPCAGTRLGLGSNQLQIAFQGSAGSSGGRTINGTAPPGACGGYMQLLDLTPCATSNVASVE